MDAFSKGYERMSHKMSWYKKWLVKIEWKRLLKYEHRVFSLFDKHIIISEQDKKLIPHPENEKIVVSPNGVDLDYYKPLIKEKRYDLIFSGNMSYEPNIESVNFLVKKVMPKLLKKRPDIKLVIAGAHPSKEILAMQSKNVEVTGWVDDMRDYYASSKICVAPMLISIGLQNKILQAMAMKVPCVVSSLANNAIGAAQGKEVLVADEPDDFAREISSLLDNPSVADQLANEALSFVQNKFNWKQLVGDLVKKIAD
jgi:glycosyltransferase involved in cell wall biosynthesis